MSRLEDYEELQQTVYEDKPKVYYSKCSYCKDPHVRDQVGITSIKSTAWWCSGACMTLYNYENRLVTYAPETVAVILDMKKRLYGPKKSFNKTRTKNKQDEL